MNQNTVTTPSTQVHNHDSLVVNPKQTLVRVENDILDTHMRSTAEFILYRTAQRLRALEMNEEERIYYADVIDVCQTILTVGRVATERGAL